MGRSMDVRRRVGPLMEKVKQSLERIHHIQEAIERRRASETKTMTHEKDDLKEGSSESAASEGQESSAPVLQKHNTRKLLKASMDMLKHKLSSLQVLENALKSSEDRRQNLHHYVLQRSFSAPILELAAKKRLAQELENQVAKLQKDCSRLEAKSSNVDELELKAVELAEKVKKLSTVEEALQEALSRIETLEDDLGDRQHKLDQQQIRCDDLECQVDQLTKMYNGLLVDETRQVQFTTGLEAQGSETDPSIPRSITHKNSSDSDSTTSTDPESDSGSSSNNENAAAGCSDDSEADKLQKLMKRLEQLEIENATLKRAHLDYHAHTHQLQKKNESQAMEISRLEQQLSAVSKQKGETSPKPTRGAFFKKFLKADTGDDVSGGSPTKQ